MSQPCYRFDQLFEKLPNGRYRERDKPVPKLDVFHRHDFFRSPHTGRICVLYPAIGVQPNNSGVGSTVEMQGMRLPTTAEFLAICHAKLLDPPIMGGNWLHGSRIDDLRRVDHWGWGGVMIDPLYMPQWEAQPATPDGTVDGIL